MNEYQTHRINVESTIGLEEMHGHGKGEVDHIIYLFCNPTRRCYLST